MRLRVGMLLLVAMLAAGGLVSAQQVPGRASPQFTAKENPAEPQTGRRIALIIGNGSYQSVARLPNPANDARLIARTLQDAGFILVGGGPQIDLDKARFDRLVQQFGKALMGADVALFYYSGHGMQVQGENWLVPVDANPTSVKDMDFQMVDASLVLRQMEDSGTKLNMVILDACRNNPFAVRGIRGASGGLGEMAAPEGTLISYATQPGNVALDGDSGDSPYTVALATAIQRPGSDVFHVFNEVGLVVKQRTGGAQQPWLATSPIAGSFYFFEGPASAQNSALTVNVVPAVPSRVPQANPFDGIWSVEVVCPTEGVAAGYRRQFGAQVTNGSIHGQFGNPSDPGSLTVDGPIDADGMALLTATGRTYNAEHNIASWKAAPAGTPYHYSINAQFDGAAGAGNRMDGVRTCNYTFKQIKAVRKP